jgi:hypothetical protein
MKTLLSAIALLLPALVAAEDYNSLAQRAFAAIDTDFDKAWAFTETSVKDDVVRIARHDPRSGTASTWTLVSVDDRDPTDEEVEEFIENKTTKKRRRRNERGEAVEIEDDEDADNARIVKFETLELIEETANYWLLSFVPNGDDDKEAKFMRQVNGELKIIKNGHYVESIELANEKPIKPATGVKIKKFQMAMRFGPAAEDGPIVPLTIDVAVAGRAMLVINFDETESIRFSDFEYAGETSHLSD